MDKSQNRPLLASPHGFTFLILLIAAPLLFFRGFGVFDDSFYLKAGEEIARGSLLYRDIFENKTPLTFYFAALIAWVGNGHWIYARLFLFLLYAACVSGFLRYTAKNFDRRTSFFATIIFATSYTLSQGYSLHTEQLCVFFALGALTLFTFANRERNSHWFLGGACLALSFLSKQTAVLYTVAVLFHTLGVAIFSRSERLQLIPRCLNLSAGFFVVVLVPVTYMAVQGALYDMYDAVVENTKHVAFDVPISFSLAFMAWARVPATSLSALSLCALLSSRRLRTALALNGAQTTAIWLWLTTSALHLLPNLRLQNTTGHYVMPTILGLSLANGLIFSRISTLTPSAAIRKASLALLAAAILPYVCAILWGGITVIGDKRLTVDLRQQEEIRSILDSRLGKDSPVLCISQGGTTRLYYLSGRPPLTRYMHFGVNFQDRFTIPQALEYLTNGSAPAALIDIPDIWDEQSQYRAIAENNFQKLQDKYEVISLKNGYHPVNRLTTYLLIRRGSGL